MDTVFPALVDLDLVYLLVKEWADRFFPQVQYRILTLLEDEIDKVHNEITEMNKVFGTAFPLRAYVEPDQVTHPMTEFGLEKVRNVVFTVTVPHLIDAGLAMQDAITRVVNVSAKIGDRFTFSDFEYDVLEVRRGHMFANTDIPVDYVFRATRFRPEVTQFSGL